MPPPGRPRNDEETCVLSVRLPVSMRHELDRYIDRLETQVGIKASRTDMIRHALRTLLEGQGIAVREVGVVIEEGGRENKPAPQLTSAMLIQEYIDMHRHEDILLKEMSAWVRQEYHTRTGLVFRDPKRAILKFADRGMLIKVESGVYRVAGQ
jgi:hypothetical protein